MSDDPAVTGKLTPGRLERDIANAVAGAKIKQPTSGIVANNLNDSSSAHVPAVPSGRNIGPCRRFAACDSASVA